MIGVMARISSEPPGRMLDVLECGDKAKRRYRFRKGAQAGRRCAKQVDGSPESKVQATLDLLQENALT
jgi:hypothetical protein